MEFDEEYISTRKVKHLKHWSWLFHRKVHLTTNYLSIILQNEMFYCKKVSYDNNTSNTHDALFIILKR